MAGGLIGGDGDGVCNCVWGTPHVDANGVCTCVTANNAVPPMPTAIAPAGTHWQWNPKANRWGLTANAGSAPHFNVWGVGNANNPVGVGGGLSGLLQNKTLLIVLGVGALLVFGGKGK